MEMEVGVLHEEREGVTLRHIAELFAFARAKHSVKTRPFFGILFRQCHFFALRFRLLDAIFVSAQSVLHLILFPFAFWRCSASKSGKLSVKASGCSASASEGRLA